MMGAYIFLRRWFERRSNIPPKGAPNHFDGSMDGEVRPLKFGGSIGSNSKREGPSDRLLLDSALSM